MSLKPQKKGSVQPKKISLLGLNLFARMKEIQGEPKTTDSPTEYADKFLNMLLKYASDNSRRSGFLDNYTPLEFTGYFDSFMEEYGDDLKIDADKLSKLKKGLEKIIVRYPQSSLERKNIQALIDHIKINYIGRDDNESETAQSQRD